VYMLSDDNSVSGTKDPTKTIIPPVHLLIPDAFSPNGDGVNDNLVIAHDANSRVELEVFNSNGVSVYKSQDYKNDWAGKATSGMFRGLLPDGTYFISVKITNISTGELVSKVVRYITIRH